MRDRFPMEEACRVYPIEWRLPEGITCPACAANGVWEMKKSRFRSACCNDDFLLTAGTLFADTHKPLRLWFEAIWDVPN